ncbi:adipocyte plasma membrane-associated protein-like isoform X2 [Bradysia coprophila]|uniref:adipocyte plasma membrane-associated protein-like isoform X2 n=1 Tax=Bradysia coprophila TaxID=38358 RepID=UPI00187DB734|nr:adipocyte plasma membrane-associated protein-like isoform X2 [Bradysia coprophila]
MKFGKFLYYSIRNFFIFFSIITFIPSLPPTTHFKIESFKVSPPRPLNTVPNNYLDNAERLLVNRVLGPEHLITNGKDIYATLVNEVVRINGDHITHVAKFGKPCELYQDALCGRPLGIAFDTISDDLIVADAYYGIWSVNPKTGDKKQLVSPNEKLDGEIPRPAKIFNSVAVSETGDIYWSDSSSDFYLEDGVQTFMANPSGRLFRYDRTQKLNVLLIDRLYFANGVALSPNEDFVLVAECAGSQIRRFYLKGSKAGTTDIFIDGLPGTPDNITPDSKGLWIPMPISRDSNHPALWQSASNAPLIRKFVLRVLSLVEMPFKSILEFFPSCSYCQMALHYIGHFTTVTPLAPSIKTVLRVDWNGQIEYVLSGKDKTVRSITHVMELDNYLYFGSFDQAYLSRVKKPAAIETDGGSYRKQTEKPTTTTPRPTTTTTAKPTTTTAKPTTTTTKPTTTTAKPTTTTAKATTTTAKPTTTTAKPETSQSTTTTARPTTTTAKPTTTTTASPTVTTKAPPSEPAPIHEDRPADTKKPEPEKLKIIKKGGAQGEL